ncbi:MAG: hypothetical protein WC767_01060 [Candidatus Paceibacterota bacterium]|jgi:hypothetical protein
MITKQLYGDIFSVTATHATAAVASKAGATDKTHYVTDIAASSDKAGAILLVKEGTTVIWQLQVGAGQSSFQFSTPLKGTSGALVSVEIDGTSACKANLSGFTV